LVPEVPVGTLRSVAQGVSLDARELGPFIHRRVSAWLVDMQLKLPVYISSLVIPMELSLLN
jgi:hypothetical protein